MIAPNMAEPARYYAFWAVVVVALGLVHLVEITLLALIWQRLGRG